jgi:hypothetical protein
MSRSKAASLSSSLLMKKGQASPSVLSEIPHDAAEQAPQNPPGQEALNRAETPRMAPQTAPRLSGAETREDLVRRERPADVRQSRFADLPADAPISELSRPEPSIQIEDAVTPKSRLVVLLPTPSWGAIAVTICAMVISGVALYLLLTADSSGTQRLTAAVEVRELAPAIALNESAAATVVEALDGPNIGETVDKGAEAAPSGIRVMASGRVPDLVLLPTKRGGVVQKSESPPAAAPEVASPNPRVQVAMKATPRPRPSPPVSPKRPQSSAPIKPAATSTEVLTAMNSGYAIQLLATNSETSGLAAWRTLSRSHPSSLQDLSLSLQRVDLGEKGAFVRVRGGPIPTKQDAQRRCETLKAAGQDCLVISN